MTKLYLNKYISSDKSKFNWLESINGSTPVITIRDYDNYYARSYQQFDIRKLSQDTLFDTESEDGRISYVRLTPYGKLEDEDGNNDLNGMFQRSSINGLNVPTLNDRFNQASEQTKNKTNNPYDNDNTELHPKTPNIVSKTMNINDMTFNSFRNQESVSLNCPYLINYAFITMLT